MDILHYQLQDRIDKLEQQLELCLEDMESKDFGRIENRIEEIKFVLNKKGRIK